jgi:tripartite-type tricarboxylate transporter receptor subunit TctC
VPTFAEVGLKDANDPAWYGLVAPAGTSDEIIRKLHEASVRALKDPGLVDRFRGASAEPAGNTPQQYTTEKREFDKMRTLVKQQNIKLAQ